MWLYSFRQNFEYFSHHFRVFALDMPGYGYTVPLRDHCTYNLETTSSALFNFMKQLEIDRASFIGHSWGGGWVLDFAARYPEMVESLVLIDSSGFNVRDVFEWELLKYPVLGTLLMKFITAGSVKKRLKRSFYNTELVSQEMADEVYYPLTFSHNRKAQLELSRNQDWLTTETAMPEINQRCLILWGDHDRYLHPELLHRFQQQLPNAWTFLFKKCGHSPHEEFPDKVNPLIAAHLKGKSS